MVGLSVTIDRHSLAYIGVAKTKKILGTGFFCLRPDWVFTAKHVVIDDYGHPRTDLAIWPLDLEGFPSTVIYTHPEVDLAVLQYSRTQGIKPLFAGYSSLTGSKGLICVGYSPTQSKLQEAAVLYVNSVVQFENESRERHFGLEELVVFEAAYSEGGHSGGPLLGEGGAVVGVVIQNFSANGKTYARATSLHPLLAVLRFPPTGQQ